MRSYFLDSSAIVKRYIPEPGHAWITDLCDPKQGHALYIAQTALVEVVASICRRAREGSITTDKRDTLIDIFRGHSQKGYSIWQVIDTIYTSGGNLCKQHKLRAYDAIQLACVLALRGDVLANETPAPIFVCADNELLNIAIAEGLSVENPNDYP